MKPSALFTFSLLLFTFTTPAFAVKTIRAVDEVNEAVVPSERGVKVVADDDAWDWIDGKDIPMEGRAFDDGLDQYCRLPASAKDKVVWGIWMMSQCSAGMQFRFTTDSRKLKFVWSLRSPSLSSRNVPCCAQSGIDVYAWRTKRPDGTETDGEWWFRCAPTPTRQYTNEYEISWGGAKVPCLINLPLYGGISEFRLGVEKGCTVKPLAVPHRSGVTKPVVFYGGSIVQGASASRPGTCWPSLVGRMIDVPIVNMGFNGQGKMEDVFVDYLAAIDASCYVFMNFGNMGIKLCEERYEKFLRTLHAKRPDAPLVIGQHCYYLDARGPLHEFAPKMIARLQKEDPAFAKCLHLVRLEDMFAPDSDGTIDGGHPNDWGSMHMAKAFSAVIAKALKRPSSETSATPDRGAWLSVPEAPVHEGKSDAIRAADGTSWFATTFTNESPIVRACWTVAGLGVFECYANGTRVGNDFLKPGYTNGKKTQYAYAYDVTGLLNTAAHAENHLAAEVGAGWWRDAIVGYLGKKSAFCGDLALTCADGSVRHVATNLRDWRCGIAGGVTHAGIYDGEEYDARNVQPTRGEGLASKPEANDAFTGELLPAVGAKVALRRDLTRFPVKAYAWKGVTGESTNDFGTIRIVRHFPPAGPYALKAGETLVLDYGQNAAAVPHFRFSAARNTVLTALPAEMLNDGNGAKSRGNDGPEGSVYRVNLRKGYEDSRLVRYTFAGGAAEYMPRFTFFGYRYLSVSATDDVTFDALTMVPVSSVMPDAEIGTLETGDASVNQLIANARWGMLSNYLSVPTDCPQRDERVGWTADTQVFCEAATYFADVRAFHRKWMRDMRDSQQKRGGYASVAPMGRFGWSTMRVGWGDAGIIVPYTVWKQFGDRAIVDENWDSMARFAARVRETKYRHDLIAEESNGYQYADWLSFEKYESNSGRYKADKSTAIRYWNYLGGCYGLIDAQRMATMARGTGRDATIYDAMAGELKHYLKATFFATDGGLIDAPFRDMQTPALFALNLGLVEGAVRDETLQGLLDNFAAHGGSLQTGFLGTSILMDTLTDCGRADAAYSLLLNHNFPGWLYSVDQGATTIWERWNSYTKEKGFGPVGMNSFNHYAYGAVVAWIYKHAAGIAADPARPGYRHIRLAPKPDRRLGHVKASYRSPAGLVTSHWRYEGATWIWTFTVPAGATASVLLPGETAARDYRPGTYTLERVFP